VEAWLDAKEIFLHSPQSVGPASSPRSKTIRRLDLTVLLPVLFFFPIYSLNFYNGKHNSLHARITEICPFFRCTSCFPNLGIRIRYHKSVGFSVTVVFSNKTIPIAKIGFYYISHVAITTLPDGPGAPSNASFDDPP
jgi:hypothetical protein